MGAGGATMDVLGKLFEVAARHVTKRAAAGNVDQFFCQFCCVRRIEYTDIACDSCGAILCSSCIDEAMIDRRIEDMICPKCKNKWLDT
jgi:hypothetical protein